MKNQWDIRYDQEAYVYGVEPNEFLREQLKELKAGKILFPGEGHGLRNNPWHGRIKLREELKWLEKYGHSSTNRSVNSI